MEGSESSKNNQFELQKTMKESNIWFKKQHNVGNKKARKDHCGSSHSRALITFSSQQTFDQLHIIRTYYPAHTKDSSNA